MDDIKTRLLASDMTYIKNKTELLLAMKTASNLYSTSTVQLKLNKFETIMNYNYTYFINPFLAKQQYDSCFLSPELHYVHQKMYLFLIQNRYFTVKPENHSFSWNIPHLFIPIFISYVFALNTTTNKPSSILQFFADLSGYLEHFNFSTVETNFHFENRAQLMEACNNWLEEYLGKSFFCLLESNLDILSSDDFQKKILRSATQPLVEMQLKLTEKSLTHLNIYCTNLLKIFFNQITPDVNKWFNYPESFILNQDRAYADREYTKLKNYFKKIYLFSKEYIDQNSKFENYPLAITNFEDFNQRFDAVCEPLIISGEKIEDYILTFYRRLIFSEQTLSYLNSGQLILNTSSIQSRAISLPQIFSSSYKNGREACNKFKQKVEKASSYNNESDVISKFNNMNYTLLKEDFLRILKKLRLFIDNEFKKHPSIYNMNCTGTIEQCKYPYFPYDEKAILEILKTLFPDLTEAHLISVIISYSSEESKNFLYYCEDFLQLLNIIDNSISNKNYT